MSKYDPLRILLSDIAASQSEITLSFEQIETILGARLPFSARHYRAWWANPSTAEDHPYAQAWLAAGWKVDTVNQRDEWVRFQRAEKPLDIG